MGEESNSSSSSSSSSGCPVAKDATVDSSNSNRSGWGSWLGWGAPKPNATATPDNTTNSSNGCPVSNNADPQQQQQQQPASLEEAARYAQTPHPDQQGVALSTHRMISSIPRGATAEDNEGPHHQPTTTTGVTKTTTKTTQDDQDDQSNKPSHWIYPSEQQFFHALRKKGWNDVTAHEIPSVLEIHNTVNERTWQQVVQWEQGMDLDPTTGGASSAVETDLKLVRFQGRPTDLSPQAFFWTKLLRTMEPPFDRHDWYVQKQPRRQLSSQSSATTSTKTEFPVQRYVIDYYMIPPPPERPDLPPTPYVDARPALDAPRAWWMRMARFVQEELPGVTSEYRSWKARRPQYFDGTGPSSTTTTTTQS